FVTATPPRIVAVPSGGGATAATPPAGVRLRGTIPPPPAGPTGNAGGGPDPMSVLFGGGGLDDCGRIPGLAGVIFAGFALGVVGGGGGAIAPGAGGARPTTVAALFFGSGGGAAGSGDASVERPSSIRIAETSWIDWSPGFFGSAKRGQYRRPRLRREDRVQGTSRKGRGLLRE